MNRVTIISLMAVIFLSCLDAPRDNVYDPENPDRAYMSAVMYEFGLYPMEGVAAYLTQEGEIIEADTSDIFGQVEFEEIVPGIYGLTGEALHYSPTIYFPESIWAGEYIADLRMEFHTLNFEDDSQGTSSPYRFEPTHGTWAIIEDNQQPGAHSTPQVYTGIDSSLDESAITLCEPEAHKFIFEARMKVNESSGLNWQAGVVFRYQDENNYYSFTVSPETTFCSLVLNGQHTSIRIQARESAPDIWQNMQVEHQEGDYTIKLRIDDVVVFSVTDNIFAGGKVGLIASDCNQPSPVYVNFDDVTLDLTHLYMP